MILIDGSLFDHSRNLGIAGIFNGVFYPVGNPCLNPEIRRGRERIKVLNVE